MPVPSCPALLGRSVWIAGPAGARHGSGSSAPCIGERLQPCSLAADVGQRLPKNGSSRASASRLSSVRRGWSPPFPHPAAPSKILGVPLGKPLAVISTVANSGGQGARIEVSSALSSPIAIQDLTASADYGDRWSARRAGFRGGGLGLRGGSIENTRRRIRQVLGFHPDRCESRRARNTAQAVP